MREADFHPRGIFRNAHVQSVLASSVLRRMLFRARQREIVSRSVEHVLECGDGVKLQAFYAEQTVRDSARGLVVVLHGWEGSAASSYVLNTGRRLLREGFDVVRLNFRDHGETHHLNREIFHSCRIDEVVGAVGEIARLFPARPLFAMGYSLGGNFALRVALRAPAHGIPLVHALAVCPAVRPHAILESIERAPWFYDHYFMQKWRSSLRRKSALYPDHYAFDDRFFKLSMRDLTAELITRYTEFGSLDAYLDGYSIHGDRLSSMEVPATVLTSRDDPIIPFADFESLALPGCVSLEVSQYGGHCGFIRDWSLESYAEDWLVSKLHAAAPALPDEAADPAAEFEVARAS